MPQLPLDSILLEGMAFYGYHGVNPEERALGQRFVVDLQVYLDLSRAGASD
ncbi:MAG: dihydroneopterin aldolase, partial [Chloroflexi bacterium]|nr:dihydroneopterin aldolase [Chloroflexota bacterium]